MNAINRGSRMKIAFHASSIVVIAVASTLNAQIRTPIATVTGPVNTPGPAPYNVKIAATSPTSASLSWDAVSGARGYTVDRTRTDDPACCVAHSGLMATPSWNDGSLQGGQQYSYVITVLYFDGRTGSTQAIVETPMPSLPVIRVPRGAEVTSSEGSLRLTACGQKTSGGPSPVVMPPGRGAPSGAVLIWPPVAGTDVNYVVDRAPEGTTTWTLVGSTCGGPSPIRVASDYIKVRDFAGGVVPGSRYVYRVYAIASNGAAGWNTYHYQAPCATTPMPQATVSGSTVTLKWNGTETTCGGDFVFPPDSYTLTSTYGFTKSGTSAWGSEAIYGVPLGTHTFSLVSNYRTGYAAPPATVSVTVAY